MHHGFRIPVAFQPIIHGTAYTVGLDRRARPPLGGIWSGFSQIIHSGPDHTAHHIGVPLRHQCRIVFVIVLQLPQISHKILIDLRPQNQLLRHCLMNQLIPLFLIIAGNKIHILSDSADPLNHFFWIRDLSLIHFIHKVLNVLNLRGIDSALFLKVRIHRIGYGPCRIQAPRACRKVP